MRKYWLSLIKIRLDRITPSIKVTEKMENEMVMADKHMQMETYIKENGKRANVMVKENKFMRTVLYMKEPGWIIKCMVKGH